MPDDGDAPPGTQVGIQLIRLESHHEIAHRGGQLRTPLATRITISPCHTRKFTGSTTGRACSVKTRRPTRTVRNKFQTLVSPKNLELVSQRHNYP
jgi:hypothetical protein